MSTPVCIANAVADALRTHPACAAAGALDLRLPLTPARVLSLLHTIDPRPRPLVQPASTQFETALPASDPWPPSDTRMSGAGPSLHAQGNLDIAATPEAVFDLLTDADALARVIPGCHGLTDEGSGSYHAEVTVGVGLIKARYLVQLRLSELDRPRSLRLAGSGQSALGTGSGDGQVRLHALPNGHTRVHYDYRAQVGGKVAMVGNRMLEGAARLLITQLFESLARQVNASPPQAGSAPPSAVKKRAWTALREALKRWLGKGDAR